jgi:hypothetical protein
MGVHLMNMDSCSNFTGIAAFLPHPNPLHPTLCVVRTHVHLLHYAPPTDVMAIHRVQGLGATKYRTPSPLIRPGSTYTIAPPHEERVKACNEAANSSIAPL